MVEVESSYRTGQLARVLGVSSYQIRRLAEAGLIEAEYSGKQWRIPARELERLQKEGVPEIPANTGATQSPPPRPKSTSASPAPGLVAAPSDDVVAAHEQADITAQQVEIRRNRLERLKMKREMYQVGDYFRKRRLEREAERAAEDQAELERAEAERRREAQAERESRRREWCESWQRYALGLIPWEAQNQVEGQVYAAVAQVLGELEPRHDAGITQRLVDSAVERALAPWRSSKETQKAIERAIYALPWDIQYNSAYARFKHRAFQAATDAINQLPESAGYSARETATLQATQGIVTEYNHREQCDAVLEDLWRQLRSSTPAELKRAEEDVGAALSKLPVGTSEQAMKDARDKALQPVLETITMRLAERQQQQEAQRHKREETQGREQAESRVSWRLLSDVTRYLQDLERQGEIEFEGLGDRWDLERKLKDKIRGPLIAEVVHNPSISDDEIRVRVKQLIDRHLDSVLAA